MRKIIVPAVIAKTQEELEAIFGKIGGGSRIIQLDVMDGRFVPNRSLDFPFFLPRGNFRFESHLMVEDPGGWATAHGESVDTIIAHAETLEDPRPFIRSVKSRGKRAALALNPETEIGRIVDFLDVLDQVLVMTVKPGFYGSPFLPDTLKKVTALRRMKPDLDIEVDGGINADTISMADKAGANLFVSGSYLVKADSPSQRAALLYRKIGVTKPPG